MTKIPISQEVESKQDVKITIESVKRVQEDMYNFVDALNFISDTAESAFDANKVGIYTPGLIKAMVQDLAISVNDRAGELFNDLGIKEPKEATGGEV